MNLAAKFAALSLVLAGIAFAQRGPTPPGRGNSVTYPGPGRAGRGYGAGYYGGGRFITPAPVGHPVHAYGVLVPIPVYYGAGYFGYDPSVPMAAQSAPAYDGSASGNGAPSQPVVVINQSYANPPGQDYSSEPPESSVHTFDATTSAAREESQPTIYLIAMQDHSIVAAIGYWVEGDTLHYLTQDGNENSLSLSLVDRDFSKQLNDDRHVEFRLPKQN